MWSASKHLHTNTWTDSICTHCLWILCGDLSLSLCFYLWIYCLRLFQIRTNSGNAAGALSLHMKGEMASHKNGFDMIKKKLTDASKLAGDELRGPIMSERGETVLH